METQELDIITSIDNFEFNKVFFCDKDKFSRLSDKAKVQNVFPFYRVLAIENPVHVHGFQHLRSPVMMSHLHHQLYSGKIPSYVYTKNLKDKFAKKHFLETIPIEVKREYIKIKDIEYSSLPDLYEFYPTETEDEIKELKKMMEQKIKTKKAKKITRKKK